MSTQLYDLRHDYAVLAELPLEAPASRDDRLQLEADLDSIQDELSPKLLALAKVVRNLEAEAELLEEHGRLLLGRANTRHVRADYLKRWMKLQMEGAGLERLRDPFVTVWLQVSPPSVEVLDEAAVPAEYKRVTLKLPLSAVPPGLLGLVHTCDVDRATIQSLIRATGELPAGVVYRQDRRHLRIN